MEVTLTPEYMAQDTGGKLIAVSIVFIVLCSIFVSLSSYARRSIRAPVGIDDFIMPIAWLTNTGCCIIGLVTVPMAGTGRHMEYVLQTDPHKLVYWAKLLYALENLYLPSVVLPKIAILCLYLRILTSRWQRIVCHVLIYFLFVSWLAYLITATLQCIRFEYQWDKTIPGGRCIDLHVFFQSVSAPNIASDIVMLVLPLPTLWKLSMGWKNKMGVLSIFLVGSMGLMASCIRVPIFARTDVFEDTTFASVKLCTWVIVEPSMYLLAASFMNIRPVLSKLLKFTQKFSSTTSGPGSSTTYRDRKYSSDGHKSDANRPLGFNPKDKTCAHDVSTGITRTVEFEVSRSSPLSMDDDIPLRNFAEQRDLLDNSLCSDARSISGRTINAATTN